MYSVIVSEPWTLDFSPKGKNRGCAESKSVGGHAHKDGRPNPSVSINFFPLEWTQM